MSALNLVCFCSPVNGVVTVSKRTCEFETAERLGFYYSLHDIYLLWHFDDKITSIDIKTKTLLYINTCCYCL